MVFDSKTRRIVKEKEVLHTGTTPFYDWLRVKLAGEEAFRKQYEKIHLLYVPEKHTLLPSNFYDKEKEREIFSLAFPLKNEETLFSEKIGEQTLLSAIPENVHRLVKEYFPSAIWKSAFAFLIRQTEDLKTWNLGVLLLYDKMCLTSFKDNKLQLCNNFTFTTKDDLLYYMLYAFDNLDIPVAESCVQLYGNQDYVKLLADELHRYHDDVVLPPQTLSNGEKTPMSNFLLLNT